MCEYVIYLRYSDRCFSKEMKTSSKKQFTINRNLSVLLLGIFLVVFFLIIFVAVPKAAKPIESITDNLGLTDAEMNNIEANAWKAPGSSVNYTDSKFSSVNAAQTISNPDSVSASLIGTSFNKSYVDTDNKDVTNTVNAWKATAKSTGSKMHNLWYRDFILADTMKKGMLNRLIDKISFSMNVTFNLDFRDNGGTIRQYFFVALGYTGTSTPTTTNFTAVKSKHEFYEAQVHKDSNAYLSTVRTVELATDSGGTGWEGLASNTNLVLRVGVSVETPTIRSWWGAGVTWPTIDFQNPTCSQFSISWTKPSLEISRHTNNNFGSLSALRPFGVVNSFAEESFTTEATATQNTDNQQYGYYFSGWTKTSSPSQTISGFDYSNRTISFRGACDIPRGTNRYYANFRRYSLDSGYSNTYTYAQTGEGVGKKQGPTVTASSLSSDLPGGEMGFITEYYKGNELITGLPSDVASYSIRIQVAIIGAGDIVSNGIHRYDFVINKFDIKTIGVSAISFEGNEFAYNGTDRSLKNPAVPSQGRIAVSKYTFRYQNVDYHIKSTDFVLDTTVGSTHYAGDWINASNNPDPTVSKPGIQVVMANNGNFTYTGAPIYATAEIKPLRISDMQISVTMKNEIDLRYDTTYTGQEVKPDVILIRLTHASSSYTLIAHDQTNSDSSRKQLYVDNYQQHGAIGDFPAYQNFTGFTTSRWVNGFFRLDLSSYSNAIEPNTSATAQFTIRIVRSVEYEHANFVDANGVLDNATINVNYNIPKRIVNDTHEDDTNSTDIVSDYSGAEHKPYPGPIVYDGAEKRPRIAYVLVKSSNVRLYVQNYEGEYFWTQSGIVYYSLTNASNQVGDPTPPTTHAADGTTYTVYPAGKFLSNVSYTSATHDNVNVASGGIVNITTQDTAKITGSFQLYFPIAQKELHSEDPLNSPGGGIITNIPNQTYNFGSAISPTITVRATFDFSEAGQANDNTVTLVEGTDYTKSFSNNTDITQNALVTITGLGNYKGVITKKFVIAAIDITYLSNVTVDNLLDKTYTGSAHGSTTETLKVRYGVAPDIIEFQVPSSEYSVSTTGGGTNINVGAGSMVILFGGNTASSGQNAGVGARFAGQRTISFNIVPKSINQVSIERRASWDEYDAGLVTYDGKAKINLPIVTTGNTKTVVVTDRDRSVVLTYGTSSASGDYMLKPGPTAWGTNPNAGLDSGSVTFVGINNYSGEITINFRILPKNISEAGLIDVTLVTGAGSGYNLEKGGFNFTGQIIEPSISKVEIDRGQEGKVTMVDDTDYIITYGLSTDSQVNIFVEKGGRVNITGKGNYTGTAVKTFNIVAINQKVTLISPSITDTGVMPESIKTNPADQLYADFEVNADDVQGRIIELEARTTAIYPSARLVTFKAQPSSTNIVIAEVTYTSCEIREIDGVMYSVTKANLVITSEKRYGRVRVYAEQYDNALGATPVTIGSSVFRNEGNYNGCQYGASNPDNDITYWLFFKKADSIDSQYASLSKTYGNNAMPYLRNKLASYVTTNPNIYGESISLTSNNTSIVSVSIDGSNWSISFNAAGSTSLVLSHGGYVNDETRAYLAFTYSIPVVVHKRNLEISFKDAESTYGQEASFTFSFRTWATDVSKGVDNHTGLSYQVINDTPEQIMTGMYINYEKDGAHKNSTSYFEGAEELHNPYLIGVVLDNQSTGIKASNYNITSAPGKLTVKRARLQASVTNVGQSNVIRRDYGQPNPVAQNIGYSGFVFGETLEDLLLQGVSFTEPTLQYVAAGNPVTQLTSIGTYMIMLIGGTSENYYIEETPVTLIILPVAPIIEIEGISIVYRAQAIGYPFTYEENGETISLSANLLPIQEGASLPDSGNISYQYRYEEQPWSSDRPRRAGTYSTRVLYTSSGGGDYKSTSKDFPGNIVITKASPGINLNLPPGITTITRVYTSEAIPGSSIQPSITGIGNDRPVGGDVSVKFRLVGETEWVNQVVNAGTYDLFISFIATANDNYTNFEKVFASVFVIKEGVVSIELQDGCVVRTPFDGNAHTFDLTKVKFLSSPRDLDPNTGNRKEIPGTATLMYSFDGGLTFSSTAPINAGSYTIYIHYETQPGYDYEGNEASFHEFRGNPLFTIEHANIINYMNLNLNIPEQISYDTEYHSVEQSLVVLTKVAGDPNGPNGTVSLGYQLSGQPSAPLLARVRDVGTYDVLLQYTEGLNDNYVYTEPRRINARVIISPVQVTISYASTYTEFDFDGDFKRISVSVSGLKNEIPRGTIRYEYSLHSKDEYSEAAPLNAGSYDIKVTYIRRTDATDNYAVTTDTKRNIIVIKKIAPKIIINNMVAAFGEIDENYVPNIILQGTDRDPIGPPLLNTDLTPTISYEFGVQGASKYTWSPWKGSSYPIESGRYSVRATYNPNLDTPSINYTVHTAVRFTCLEIKNISPELVLAKKTAFFNGSTIPANIAEITNAIGITPKGRISYEYQKQNTSNWRNIPPIEVGVYHVRVNYIASTTGDSFSSFSKLFPTALEILALPLTIIPILGQGTEYGGRANDELDIIFAYSYMEGGFKRFVYPKVVNGIYGDVIDVSNGTYVPNSGSYGYTLDMVDGVAWRDYYKQAMLIDRASFNYVTPNGIQVTETINNMDSLTVNNNIAEFRAGNREYLIDLENSVAMHKNDFDTVALNYGRKQGLFFSITDSDGNIDVIEIVRNRIEWTNSAQTMGRYKVVRLGRELVFTISIGNMTATYGSKVYKITEGVGLLEYSLDSGATRRTVLIDERELFAWNLQENSALYRSSDGYVYKIVLNENRAYRRYPVKINRISFSYQTDKMIDGQYERKNVSLDVSTLTSKYINETGIYTYKDEGACLDFIIDVKNKVVLKNLTYKFEESMAGNYFEYIMNDGQAHRVYVQDSGIVATDRSNIIIYTDAIYQKTYYIDIVSKVVRHFENKGSFHPGNKVVSFTDSPQIPVDFHSIYFTAYEGSSKSRLATIFNQDLIVTKPTLPQNNTWIGGLKVDVTGAGEYLIDRGQLSINSNYTLTMSAFGVEFSVDKAPLVITYRGYLNNVYDGKAKYVYYDVFGLQENDSLELLGLMETIEGDNVRATAIASEGYRLVLSLNPSNFLAANYYIVNNKSPYFRIERANMEPIIFTPIDGGIDYNQVRHVLKLEDIEGDDVVIKYNGSTEPPSFINPGTYFVNAEVSRPNYIPQTVLLSLTINRATYNVQPHQVTRQLRYKEALPILTSDSDLGTYQFVAGQELHPDKTEYNWEFIPHREDFYKYYQGLMQNDYVVRGKMTLDVKKAKPTVNISGALAQVEGSPFAISAKLVELENVNVSIRYIGADGSVYETLPTAPGKYSVLVEYEGNDEFESVVYKTDLTINAKRNLTWLWIAGGAIVALALLSVLFFLIKKPKKYA